MLGSGAEPPPATSHLPPPPPTPTCGSSAPPCRPYAAGCSSSGSSWMRSRRCSTRSSRTLVTSPLNGTSHSHGGPDSEPPLPPAAPPPPPAAPAASAAVAPGAPAACSGAGSSARGAPSPSCSVDTWAPTTRDRTWWEWAGGKEGRWVGRTGEGVEEEGAQQEAAGIMMAAGPSNRGPRAMKPASP